MKKFTVIFTIFIAAIIAFFAYRMTTTPGNGEKGPSLLTYVPADTSLYIGGGVSSDISEVTGEMPLNLASSLAELRQALSNNMDDLDDGQPWLPLTQALLEDLQSNVVKASDLDTHLGIDDSSIAIYLHGAFPVIRGYLADPKVFDQYWDSLAKSANVVLQPQTLDNVTYHTLLLAQPPEGQGPSISLAIKRTDKQFTLALVSAADTPELLKQRLAITAPKQTLADAKVMDGVKKSVGLDDGDIYGFIDFTRLAAGILHTDKSQLAADITRLGKAYHAPDMSVTADCQNEYNALVAMVPRLVLGARYENAGDGVIHTDTLSRLEMKSSLLTGAFQSISGHLPNYGSSEDALVGVRLGLNVGQLAPVLSDLWREATQYDAKCPSLRNFQAQLHNANPAMLGLFTSMLQGVKGAGVSLYDVDVSSRSPSVDALMTVSGENTDLLVNLFNQFVLPRISMGNGQPLKNDGSVASYDLSMIAPGQQLNVVVEGKNIAAYTGDKSKKVAEGLKKEKLDSAGNLTVNGLVSAQVNYPRLASLMESVPAPVLGMMGKDDPCMWQAKTLMQLRGTPASLTTVMTADEHGLLQTTSTDLNVSAAGKGSQAIGEVAGKYDLFDLNENCMMPVIMGHEEINADGTGSYAMSDDGGRCSVREFTYHWERQGDHMIFSFDSGRTRDDCGAEWQSADTSEGATCDLIPTEGGFNCLYSDEGGTALIGYRHQQATAAQ